VTFGYFNILGVDSLKATFTNSGEPCASDYIFINPYPDCELYENKLAIYTSLEKKLDDFVKVSIASGKANKISIWSRDLTTRRFVGINENTEYAGASLLKLPLMIAYFKLAEVSPEILQKKISYTVNPNLYSGQFFKPKKELVPGTEYTIDELIERMVSYSDNTATALLALNVNADLIRKVQQAVGIEITLDSGETDRLVTARGYGSIMRTLYNSSYLTRELSEKAILYLSRADFAEGSPAKLPKEVVVAHKFGERAKGENSASNTKELHDCGIVYAKNGEEPYSFCIMTEGNDFNSLLSVIQDVSGIIYTEVIKPQ